MGRARVRYAATGPHGAAQERYRDTGSFVPADHAGHHVVALRGDLQVVDLRREATLDALGADDRLSTGREPEVWRLAQELTDLALDWWSTGVHAIAYRSRTTPETSTNVAFFAHAPLSGRSRRLDSATALLDELVIRHGFTVDF